MTQLWTYFGLLGMASLAAGAVVVVLLAAGAVSRRRTSLWWGALAMAVVTAALARANVMAVAGIRVDRSAEIAAMQERLRQQREQVLRAQARRAADIRFAEDNPADRYDLAGMPEGSRLLEDRPGEDWTQAEYAYRLRGRQQRAEGASQGHDLEGLSTATETDEGGRALPEGDVVRANRWALLNRALARMLLLGAAIAAGTDYLLRLNLLLGAVMPLPIAGRWLDAIRPKKHVLGLAGGLSSRLPACLQQAVRKGETFIYFGRQDPWAAQQKLPRLPGPLPPGLLGGRLWLEKLQWSADSPLSSEFVLESAWFARHCFVVVGLDDSLSLLKELVRFLQAREVSHAWAARAVNVAWDHDQLPQQPMLEELACLCRQSNFRLVVSLGDEVAADRYRPIADAVASPGELVGRAWI